MQSSDASVMAQVDSYVTALMNFAWFRLRGRTDVGAEGRCCLGQASGVLESASCELSS